MAVFEKKPMLIAIYNHSQLLGLLTKVLYKRGVELTDLIYGGLVGSFQII